jgi:hypothetical protein
MLVLFEKKLGLLNGKMHLKFSAGKARLNLKSKLKMKNNLIDLA